MLLEGNLLQQSKRIMDNPSLYFQFYHLSTIQNSQQNSWMLNDYVSKMHLFLPHRTRWWPLCGLYGSRAFAWPRPKWTFSPSLVRVPSGRDPERRRSLPRALVRREMGSCHPSKTHTHPGARDHKKSVLGIQWQAVTH